MNAELTKIVGESPQVTRINSGKETALGPVYSRIGYLLFCQNGKVLHWQDGAIKVFREDSNGARALTFDHQGRLLACEKDRLTRTEKNGRLTVLAKGVPADVMYAIDQNIYYCDGKAVYRVKGEGSPTVASRECAQPAGVALSPNQQQLYVSDSSAQTIRVFDLTARGQLSNGRVFAHVKQSPLGGLKTDEAGRVWVAGPRGILVFGREGAPLGTVPISEPPSNLNWGAGFRDLIVTAGNSVYHVAAHTNGTRTY